MITKNKLGLGILLASTMLSGNVMASGWTGLVSANVGHDDNVTLGDDDSDVVGSDLKDNFLDVLGVAGRYLTGDKDDGIRFTGTLYNREYDTDDDFNFFLISGGLAYHKKLGDWHGRFGAKYDYLEFGGDPYESIITLSAEGRHKLSKDTEIRIRYRYSDIDAESSQFNNIDGDRHRINAEYRLKHAGNRYRFIYTYETNDRNDSVRTPTTFSSSSPVRHTIRANAKIPLNTKWGTEFDVRYRDSRYKDENVIASVEERRNDDRLKVKAELNYKIDRKTDVFVDYTYTDNDSNINSFDYDRNEVSVGVNYLF